MRWPDAPVPAPMSRVAVVAPVAALRPVLVGVAGAGTVQVDPSGTEAAPGEADAPAAAARTRGRRNTADRRRPAGPRPARAVRSE